MGTSSGTSSPLSRRQRQISLRSTTCRTGLFKLDFTVIGPGVNLTSRIEWLCRELDRNVLMSEDFVCYLDSPVSEIGHFRLRGLPRMQRNLVSPYQNRRRLACHRP